MNFISTQLSVDYETHDIDIRFLFFSFSFFKVLWTLGATIIVIVTATVIIIWQRWFNKGKYDLAQSPVVTLAQLARLSLVVIKAISSETFLFQYFEHTCCFIWHDLQPQNTVCISLFMFRYVGLFNFLCVSSNKRNQRCKQTSQAVSVCRPPSVVINSQMHADQLWLLRSCLLFVAIRGARSQMTLTLFVALRASTQSNDVIWCIFIPNCLWIDRLMSYSERMVFPQKKCFLYSMNFRLLHISFKLTLSFCFLLSDCHFFCFSLFLLLSFSSLFASCLFIISVIRRPNFELYLFCSSFRLPLILF